MGPVVRLSREPRNGSAEPFGGQPVQPTTLEDLLAAGPIEPRRTLELLADVADALDAAHARGDDRPNLHPGTVIVGVGGDRAAAGFDPHRSVPAPAGGPLQYMSPERILDEAETTSSAVYSLTTVLYRCLTGSVPFPRGRGRSVLFWHLHAPRPRVTDLRPDLPAAIDRVIARGMATDPASRHPTAQALIEDGRRALRPAVDVAPGPDAADAIRRAPGAEQADRGSGRGNPLRRALMALVALVAAGCAAGAVGFAVAGTFDDPPPQPAPASAGPIELAAPADWRPSTTTAAPAALALVEPLVLAPVGSDGTRLVAGVAGPPASVALLVRLHASPPAGDVVALNAIRARRYRAARLPGTAGPATLYLAPTARGVATVACLADSARAAAAFMSRCDRIAGSLRLAGGHAVPPGPSARQTAGVRRVFRRLNSARARYRSHVDRSRAPADQAAAAGALARAHERQTRALRSLRLAGLAQPGGQAAARALERAARAYRAVARAAIRDDRSRYAAARRSAMAADGGLRRALRMLRVVGYGV